MSGSCLYIYISSLSCSKPTCKDQFSLSGTTDIRMLNYVFRQGSYFIYSDTADGVIDSQYVYAYTYSKHVWIDSVSPYYVYNSTLYCGPYYRDLLYMKYSSYYNGVWNDSFISVADGAGLSIAEGDFRSYGLLTNVYQGVPVFYLDQTKPGLINPGYKVTTQSYYIAYLGHQAVTVSGVAYSADVFRTLSYLPRYVNTNIDLYLVDNIGIVKIIEHRQTGDVSRDLIRYHIAN
jgi:hypothetical protein